MSALRRIAVSNTDCWLSPFLTQSGYSEDIMYVQIWDTRLEKFALIGTANRGLLAAVERPQSLSIV